MSEIPELKNERFRQEGSRLFSPDGLGLARGEKPPNSSEFWFRASIGLAAGVVFFSVMLW